MGFYPHYKICILFFCAFVISISNGWSSPNEAKFIPAMEEKYNVDLSKFSSPFCVLKTKQDISFRSKYRKLVKLQKHISRSPRHFYKNLKLEQQFKLHGSPKWLAYRYFKEKGFNDTEIEFAFFIMTLFGEARNLSEEGIEMVARVINNRRRGKSYVQTVTRLAQFSSWYYKNRRDNVALLCPSSLHNDNWKRVVKVAFEQFLEKDDFLKSKYYFAPYNMVPRNSIPYWAKGVHVVRFGGHLFLVDEAFVEKHKHLEMAYIDEEARKVIFKDEGVKVFN